jgi:CUB domain
MWLYGTCRLQVVLLSLGQYLNSSFVQFRRACYTNTFTLTVAFWAGLYNVYFVSLAFERQVVTLNFYAFSTESCCDFVTLYDGYDSSATQLAAISGRPTFSGSGYSTTQRYMYITFTSDSSSSWSGFSATYSSFEYTRTTTRTMMYPHLFVFCYSAVVNQWYSNMLWDSQRGPGGADWYTSTSYRGHSVTNRMIHNSECVKTFRGAPPPP